MRFLNCLAILAVALTGCIAQNNVSKWDALSNLQGRKIALSTMDGARLQGTAIRWQPQALSMQISKSTDANRFPVGESMVPRQSIRTIEVSRNTKRWRVIGTVVGVAVGLPVAVILGLSASGGILSNQHETRGSAVAFGTLAGTTAGCFFIGWALDRHKTVIVVNP